jgi:hypothetical protein
MPSIQEVARKRQLQLSQEVLDSQNSRRRALFLEFQGCVIRALESATGHESPDWVIDKRRADLAKTPTFAHHLVEGETDLFRASLDHEITNILELIDASSTDQSPFGNRLANFDVIQQEMPKAEILDSLQSGTPLLIIGNDPLNTLEFHVIHAGLDTNGELVSLSDVGRPRVTIPSNKSLPTIVFRPRE